MADTEGSTEKIFALDDAAFGRLLVTIQDHQGAHPEKAVDAAIWWMEYREKVRQNMESEKNGQY